MTSCSAVIAHAVAGLVGFVEVEHTAMTIEHQMFEALVKTRLIESPEAIPNYSRCGRTDKCVSAFSQVAYDNVLPLVIKSDAYCYVMLFLL